MVSKKEKLKIIPLGGLDEIGKNLTVIEYGEEILVIDCGLAFPSESMLGIDLVIPDTAYLARNRKKVVGLVLTHGHEDHIGAVPYALKNFNAPIYGSRMTLGLLEHKLREHGMASEADLNTVKPGTVKKIGQSFKVEFINVNHSIAGALALAIHTPVGVLVHTGDFKIDCTPINGEMINLTRLGDLGRAGVLALFSDSTNVERSGYTMSERTVGERFDEIFKKSPDKRIIVASFASNVHRIQQIINSAVRNKRKVAVSGRSMLTIIEVAMELGYLHVPKGTIIDIEEIGRFRPEQLVIVTTGSQGEPMSALTRMAFSDHRSVEIGHGDLVILSANPIPGNEKAVSTVINELFKKGAEVIYESLAEVHVSGHACQEELKLMLGLVKPKYFIPVHGEHRHLVRHARLGELMGVKPENVFVMSLGEVLELNQDGAAVTGNVTAGQVLVDGIGVGDVGNIVLRDRKHLGEEGLIVAVVTLSKEKEILAGPDIISRGFVYVRESEDLMEEMKDIVNDAVIVGRTSGHGDWNSIKTSIRNMLGDFIFDKTKRKPVILPVITEV
ncbi:MAG: ribonuclease J [Ruminococcaceae bacterium]|nr:ribonuclease J [Oscillospiraceae bacterium]